VLPKTDLEYVTDDEPKVKVENPDINRKMKDVSLQTKTLIC